MDAPATKRHQGRSWALQMLVQADLNPFASVDMILAHFWEQQWSCRQEEAESRGEAPAPAAVTTIGPEGLLRVPEDPGDRLATRELREFTEALVRGALTNQPKIDATLTRLCENWSLDRLGVIERCVLRLAVYELDAIGTPAPVVINEAIELAKDFANREAGAYVNGVLDKYAKTRPHRA